MGKKREVVESEKDVRDGGAPMFSARVDIKDPLQAAALEAASRVCPGYDAYFCAAVTGVLAFGGMHSQVDTVVQLSDRIARACLLTEEERYAALAAWEKSEAL